MRARTTGRPSFVPRLERLEARDCPAFSIHYTSSALQITGHPTLPFAAPGDGLQLTLQANGLLRVQEVGNAGATVANLGSYKPVANLFVQLDYTNRDITLDLGGQRLVSNVYINLGKGDFATPPGTLVGRTLVNIVSGTIGGNLLVVGGGGAEFVSLGGFGFVAGNPVTIQGNTTLVMRGNQTPAGQTLFAFGNVLDLNPGSEIRGHLITTGVENVNVGESGLAPAIVRKGVSMSNAKSAYVGILNIFGEVDGNVSFFGSPAFQAPIVDTVFEDTTGLVTGNLTATLGPGGGAFTLSGEVDGSTWVSSLAGDDFVNLQGSIFGSAFVHLGNGTNTVTFNGTALIAGNLTITAGNGDNTLNLAGTLDGNLCISLGNGDNTAVVFTDPGGQLTWTSGNGTDSLTLGPGFYNVFVTFGTGSDTFTLDPGTTLTGTVVGQGGSYTFNDNGATLLPTLHLINFP